MNREIYLRHPWMRQTTTSSTSKYYSTSNGNHHYFHPTRSMPTLHDIKKKRNRGCLSSSLLGYHGSFTFTSLLVERVHIGGFHIARHRPQFVQYMPHYSTCTAVGVETCFMLRSNLLHDTAGSLPRGFHIVRDQDFWSMDFRRVTVLTRDRTTTVA